MGGERGTYGRERDLSNERVGDVHECAHARDERRALDGPEGDDGVVPWCPSERMILDTREDDGEQYSYSR